MSVRILPPGADIFASGAQAIVIPTNTRGVQGAGLALAAAKRWPAWEVAYREDCDESNIAPGEIVAYPSGVDDLVLVPPLRWIVAMATKDHWRDPSRLAWVVAGLHALAAWCRSEMVARVAVPAVGAGLGGLPWETVRPLIVDIMGDVTGCDVAVYAPHEAPAARPRRSGGRG